jgi:pimeloyl-ACP methyl ester carboxylesterase
MSEFINGTFNIKDGSINYSFRHNTEPVYVFLYGGFGDIDKTTWKSLIQKLPDSFSILTYDRPGIGFSKPVSSPRTAIEITSELKSLLDYLNIKKAILIGHSIGGLYARYFASRFPEYINGLLLLDATHEHQFKENSKFLPENDINDSIESVQHNPEGIRIPLDPDTSFEQMSRFSDLPKSFLIFVVAAEKSMPTTIPNSNEINDINIELQKKLASTSKSAEFLLAKGCSHFIYLDQTDFVVSLIKNLGNE